MLSASVQCSCGGNQQPLSFLASPQLNECIWCKCPSTRTGHPDEVTGTLNRCAPFLMGVGGVSSCLNVMCGSWQQVSTCSNTWDLLETEAKFDFARQQNVILQCWTLLCLRLDRQKHVGISENERSWPVFAKSEFHRKNRKHIFLSHEWVGRIRTISPYLSN